VLRFQLPNRLGIYAEVRHVPIQGVSVASQFLRRSALVEVAIGENVDDELPLERGHNLIHLQVVLACGLYEMHQYGLCVLRFDKHLVPLSLMKFGALVLTRPE
jgi:hypothetical protein